MKLPPFLKPGDKVSIVSPAGIISRQIAERGAALLREQGFQVVIGPHAFAAEGVFAGSDSDRASDMQAAMDDKNIRAIFFSRGGYGSLRTHLKLNWSSFFRKPKWLIGFSDITVFHSYLSLHNIASVHGVMTAWFEQDGKPSMSFIKLMELLRGNIPDYDVTPHQLNKYGKVSGILTGGNLSIIQSLRGTPLDISPKGKILFIEDVDEPYYHLDRMMMNLKAGGILARISGLVAGHFTDIKDREIPFGKTACEIIAGAVEQYRYPVVFGFQAGHDLPNYPLLMGNRILLDVSEKQVTVKTLKRP